ncbi:MAG: nitroreductase family protein [Candidatus Pacearchaeota archaeon]|nr:nitroreductase family protein [Candidatus Pacearchaeota archaeon]
METIECIKSRRSRRKYLKKDIDNKILEEIVDVVRYCPSSLNCQPWEIVIVKEQEIKNKIFELKKRFMPEFLIRLGYTNECIVEAPVLIVVCVDTKKSPSRWLEDGVFAANSLLLAINNLGLGGFI